jgi:hypothetical protein
MVRTRRLGDPLDEKKKSRTVNDPYLAQITSNRNKNDTIGIASLRRIEWCIYIVLDHIFCGDPFRPPWGVIRQYIARIASYRDTNYTVRTAVRRRIEWCTHADPNRSLSPAHPTSSLLSTTPSSIPVAEIVRALVPRHLDHINVSR